MVLFYIVDCRFIQENEKLGGADLEERSIQITAYVFALFLIVTIVSLPLDWISYQYSLDYGISTQTTASWIKDQVIDFWISFPITAAAVIVFYYLIKKHENAGGFMPGV